MKNIAVLTSGGDAPGMNAAIRAVVRIALLEKLKVFGIYNGYQGLVDNQILPLHKKSVGNIIHRGGTILKSARSKDFQSKEGRNKAYQNLVEHQIDAVIVIGGDGTFAGAIQFTQEFNIPFIGIPGTIDNDLFGTDYTIGFKSAVQTAMECVDKIRDTANAFKRLFFIEVMGRDVGAIALATGIATGAEDIFIPETKTNLIDLSERLKRGTDKESYIIIVSEGDDKGGAENIAAEFKKTHPEYDIKTLVLGHLLRGGNPTAEDRILAARLGVAAVQSLIQKEFNVMIGIQRNEIAKTPLHLCKKHFLKINEEWENLIYKLS
ncbi:MAG: 6-phosphofructokinase [Bacteroidetes bacterium]|nr:6-phosphofructokinase [Bacteroidota bacterium]MCB9074882.1 6-phosphofructokinase [Chitinophagales bacterium]